MNMITEEEKAKWIKKATFICERLNARIAKENCIENQKAARNPSGSCSGYKDITEAACHNCEVGKKYYNGKEDREPKKKECVLHQLNPANCVNQHKGGIFTESKKDAGKFNVKQACCHTCSSRLAKYKTYPWVMNGKGEKVVWDKDIKAWVEYGDPETVSFLLTRHL